MSKQSNLGSKVDEMVLTNIKIWHEATKVKDINGKLRSKSEISLDDRVDCALEIRRLNRERSDIRWSIDRNLGSGANETKVFTKE
jgi:hypothetical protein